MCGIAGILTEPAGDPAAERWRAAVRRMTTALRHRGPDGEGFFEDRGQAAALYLGHRRLAIFDPSPVGAQPMTDPSGRYTLVFNGAIYNFTELLGALGAAAAGLRSRADTEVLLRAWVVWGPACLPRLNGMFAFALWDSVERTLYLCRDRFGVKPLLYATAAAGARLLFGSEAKALFATGLLEPAADLGVLAEFLHAHNADHHAEKSAFVDVKQVPAGCYLRLAPQTPPRLVRYFQLAPAPAAARRPLDAALLEEARALLHDALQLRLRSDVAVGGSLSGGLDSSLLTALTVGPLWPAWSGGGGRRGGEGGQPAPYRIFISQFPAAAEAGDETGWAEQVLAALPAERVLALRCTPSAFDFARDLEDVLYHQEAPFADTSICAHYALMRLVQASGVKVLLSGQGGDEVFGGYGSYYYARLGALLRTAELSTLRAELQARHRLTGEAPARLLLGALYHSAPAALRELLYRLRQRAQYPLSPLGWRLCRAAPRRFAAPLPALCAEPAAAWSALDRYLADSMARWALPHILRQDDRNSMAFGIESRAPYLDYRLSELLFRTAPTVRLSQGYSKRLLREVARGVLPEPIRLRVDKQPFFSPQRAWLWENEALVRAACAPLPPALAALTDARRFAAALERFYRQREAGLSGCIWAGLVTSLWLQRAMPRLRSGCAAPGG